MSKKKKKTKSIGYCNCGDEVVLAESAAASASSPHGATVIPVGETVKVVSQTGDTTLVDWQGATYEIDDANQVETG